MANPDRAPPRELIELLARVRRRSNRFRKSATFRDMLELKQRDYLGCQVDVAVADIEPERALQSLPGRGPRGDASWGPGASVAAAMRAHRLNQFYNEAVEALAAAGEAFFAHKAFGAARKASMLLDSLDMRLLAQYASVSDPLVQLMRVLQTPGTTLAQQYIHVHKARRAYETGAFFRVVPKASQRHVPARAVSTVLRLRHADLLPVVRLFVARVLSQLEYYFPSRANAGRAVNANTNTSAMGRDVQLSFALDPRTWMFRGPAEEPLSDLVVVTNEQWALVEEQLEAAVRRLCEREAQEEDEAAPEESNGAVELTPTETVEMVLASLRASFNRRLAPPPLSAWASELASYRALALDYLNRIGAKQHLGSSTMLELLGHDVLLGFWREHAERLPRLALLARQSFSNFATSLSSAGSTETVETKKPCALTAEARKNVMLFRSNTEFTPTVSDVFMKHKIEQKRKKSLAQVAGATIGATPLSGKKRASNSNASSGSRRLCAT